MNSKFASALMNSASKLGVEINWNVAEQFNKYYELLVEENNKYNLTAITRPEEAAEKHFIDSLMLLSGIPCEFDIKVVDVGSGAGFPGLPLKIYRKELQVTLLDSVRKKTVFMEKVIKELALQGVRVVNERAEEHASTHRAKYDVVVSRAVAETRVLAELTIPLVRKGGKVIISKGPGIFKELKDAERALTVLGGKVLNVNEIELPLCNSKRNIVIIEKDTETPDKYPRRPGIPLKKPL